jgi:hypothetical protein
VSIDGKIFWCIPPAKFAIVARDLAVFVNGNFIFEGEYLWGKQLLAK